MKMGGVSQAAASPPAPVSAEDTLSFAYFIFTKSSGEHSKLNL